MRVNFIDIYSTKKTIFIIASCNSLPREIIKIHLARGVNFNLQVFGVIPVISVHFTRTARHGEFWCHHILSFGNGLANGARLPFGGSLWNTIIAREGSQGESDHIKAKR